MNRKSDQHTFKEYFAEFLGTMAITFFGGWASILAIANRYDAFGTALVLGSVLAVFTWISFSSSKCHFNPALTLGGIISGQLSAMKGGIYMVSQFLGAFVGVLCLQTVPATLLSGAATAGFAFGTPHYASANFNFFSAAVAELLGTFVLAFAYASLAASGVERLSISVGIAYAVAIVCFARVTGGCFNPFRYFAPALYSMNLWDAHVYLISPFVGAIGGSMFHKFILGSEEPEKQKAD